VPKIDIVLPAHSISTTMGVIGFCGVFLIEGERRILVDPAHCGRRPFLEAALQQRGPKPTDIDLVVLTHAHWDHVQNIDVFDHAPLLLHPDERRYSHKPHRNDWATPQWTGLILERQDLREVGEGSKVMQGVTIMEMVGHSPGSIAVMVETDGGLAAITGDALHYASVALTGVNPLVFWDPEAASKSIERVVDAADVLYPGHDRPFKVANGKIEYTVPHELTLTSVGPETPGIQFVPDYVRPVWNMPGIGDDQQLDEGIFLRPVPAYDGAGHVHGHGHGHGHDDLHD
jgi:glyoxylase-like metal-dependent hydrolase (beta-lactamase superfamily II)